MSLKQFRWGLLIEAILIWFSGYTIIYYYLLVLLVSVEILNRKQVYLSNSPGRWNAFYLFYVIFITLERGRGHFYNYVFRYFPENDFYFSKTVETGINMFEHFMFAIMVCSQLYFFIQMQKWWKPSPLQAGLTVMVLFNIIGLANESFQNLWSQRAFFDMQADARKDLLMNLCGSLVFLLISTRLMTNKKKKEDATVSREIP
jgi:hypothetical protein